MFGLKVLRALVSVSDKRFLDVFGKGLAELGVEIISTGGTAKYLSEYGVSVTEVNAITGFPEMLDGRVKTLHPIIEGGILADRRKLNHMDQVREYDIPLIDLVCVNLYPFSETVAKPACTIDDAVENIDVGGPTLIRAAAKNHASVAALVDPNDYENVLSELKENNCFLSNETLRKLAVKAFAHTAEYDSKINMYLSKKLGGEEFPETYSVTYDKLYDLRYGENSHQMAAFYSDGSLECSVANAKVISDGKKLSFNNILDINASIELVKEFDKPAAVIVKHLNPSGVGVSDDIFDAYMLAHKADPLSAFGCIVALNREPDVELAKKIVSTFVEVVLAPSFSPHVLEILHTKDKMRILELGLVSKTTYTQMDLRRVVGGLLVQTPDLDNVRKEDLKVVSKKTPTDEDLDTLLFAWSVCRHTKSNSIILAKPGYTVGVGAGQMSRVDAVKLAAMKAGEHAIGSVLASDAFFPFPDGIHEAAKSGVKAIIQPGGSVRDGEVIKACDEAGLAMVFCSKRCFLH